MHGVPRVALYNKRFSKGRVVINTRLPPHTINVLLIYNVLFSTCLWKGRVLINYVIYMALSIASIDVTFIQRGGLISLVLKILLGSSNTQLKINMIK